MSGQLLRHPPVAVDFWKLRDCSHVRLFFLSHMHSDHTQGLTPSWSQPIYCSPVTRLLLIDQFKLNPQQVHALDLNDCHCLPLSEVSSESLSVTLIDANHCPGAVMFFFEGYFGRILYTGDFRYSPLLNGEESFARVCSSPVDRLYLDNTFCSPRCIFPPREKAVSEMVRIISEHPDSKVVLGLRSLGKECLLVVIAKYFRTRIFVLEERLRRLELLRMPDVFTTVESETRINVVDQGLITQRNMDLWNKEVHTVAIIPTALYTVLNINSGLNRSDVFVVPYSDHSSFSELCEFVTVVGPREVIPILTGVKDRLGKTIPERVDMSCFTEYLDEEPPRPFCPPIEFTAIKRDVTKSLTCVASSSVTGRKIKKFKFEGVVRFRGVVYEHSSGDEQSQNSACRAEGNVTVGRVVTGTNDQELEDRKGTRRVDENGSMCKTAVDVTNVKYPGSCAAEFADIRKRKRGAARSEHKEVCRSVIADETVDRFNFRQTGSEPAVPSISCDDRCYSRKMAEKEARENNFNICENRTDTTLPVGSPLDGQRCQRDRSSTDYQPNRDRNSKKMVGKEATENAHSFSICKDCADLTLPALSSLERDDGLRCSSSCSPRLVGNELEGNENVFNSSESVSEQSAPLITAKELNDLKRIDSSRHRSGKNYEVNVDNFSTICSEQTVPLKEHEVVQKCRQGSSFLGIDDVGSPSTAVSWQALGGDDFNSHRNEDILTTLCSEGNGEVMQEVSHEGLKLPDLILRTLQPIFAKEAQSMFETFLQTQNKH